MILYPTQEVTIHLRPWYKAASLRRKPVSRDQARNCIAAMETTHPSGSWKKSLSRSVFEYMLMPNACLRPSPRNWASGLSILGREDMNRHERMTPSVDEAEVEFLDADFRVRRAGSHVICAVTGARIPLGELRYWSVERQEAYRDAAAALQRLQGLGLVSSGD